MEANWHDHDARTRVWDAAVAWVTTETGLLAEVLQRDEQSTLAPAQLLWSPC